MILRPPRATPPRRRGRSRRLLVPEGLEGRHLLSVALPGIAATDPADLASLLRAPQAVTITFDPAVVAEVQQAMSPFLSVDPDQVLPAIVADDFGQDVEVDRVGADGSLTPYAGGAGPAVQEAVATTTAADGTTQTRLVVTPAPGTPEMQPGTYQLAIEPGTLLAWAFGSATDPEWYTAAGSIPIARFQVTGQGPTLVGAIDVGTVGAGGQDFASMLQPSDYRWAVALFRFELPPGGSWRVDATAMADAIGSPLLPALSLFDADGRVLATRNNGTGSSASPDPELIRDLPGGTYYLGVSAAGNLPGTAGGYDPVTGRPGTRGTDQPAGLFDLRVTAAPSVPPATVIGSRLEHLDPLVPSPTALDLTVSAPVDTGSLTPPDQAMTALTVVDASGRSWPISFVDEGDSGPQLRFVFDEPLPAGTYSLVSPASGGLTDLSGRPVAGPDGDPPGVLATWTVAEEFGPAEPGDLGVVWPGTVNTTWDAGVSQSVALAAGQEIDERFTAVCPGIYGLQTLVGDGTVGIRIEAADGTTERDIAGPTGLARSYFELEPGTYVMRLTGEGSQPAAVALSLRAIWLDYEKIAGNGVGQLPELTQLLGGPASAASGTSVVPGWTGSPSSTTATVATAGGAAIGGAAIGGAAIGGAAIGGAAIGGAASGAAATAVPSSASATAAPAPVAESSAGGATAGRAAAPSARAALLMSLESAPAGLPKSGDWHAAAVGPLAVGATVALSDAGQGLPGAVLGGATLPGIDPTALAGVPAAGQDLAPSGPSSVEGPALASAVAGPRTDTARADAMALALVQSDPMIQLAGWLAGRLPGAAAIGTPSVPFAPSDDPGDATLLAAIAAPGDADVAEPAGARGRVVVAQADLGVPFALLVGTALTYRLTQPIRRWWRRHPAQPALPRPHGFARAGLAVSRT